MPELPTRGSTPRWVARILALQGRDRRFPWPSRRWRAYLRAELQADPYNPGLHGLYARRLGFTPVDKSQKTGQPKGCPAAVNLSTVTSSPLLDADLSPLADTIVGTFQPESAPDAPE